MQIEPKTSINSQSNQDIFLNKHFQNSDLTKKQISNQKHKVIDQEQYNSLCYKSNNLPIRSQKNHTSWKNQEIRNLFTYYDQFGSRWSQIQVYFPQKTQNNIKNKFYGYLKMLLRHLFKEVQNVSGQHIKHLSANQISQIYEGIRKYRKFKGLLKNLMKQSQYQVSKKNIKSFVECNQIKVKELCRAIYATKKLKKENSQINKNLNNDVSVQIKLENVDSQKSSQKIKIQPNSTSNFNEQPLQTYFYNPNMMLFFNQDLINYLEYNNFYSNYLMSSINQ